MKNVYIIELLNNRDGEYFVKFVTIVNEMKTNYGYFMNLMSSHLGFNGEMT